MNDILYSLVLSQILLLPFAVKWELRLAIVLPGSLVIGLVSGVIVSLIAHYMNFGIFLHVAMNITLILTIALVYMLFRFYRDPDRTPPENENYILSPADGRVKYIKKIEKGEVPYSEKNGRSFALNEFTQSSGITQDGYLIGIAMDYLDVHVNRAPMSGTIRLIKHIRGVFLSLKRPESVFKNERAFTIIDDGTYSIGIVQIASRLVRRIIPYYREGQIIAKGARMGVIKFGSQVDVVLPQRDGLQIKTEIGDKVKAGITVIATLT